jgi:hypothetical protein
MRIGIECSFKYLPLEYKNDTHIIGIIYIRNIYTPSIWFHIKINGRTYLHWKFTHISRYYLAMDWMDTCGGNGVGDIGNDWKDCTMFCKSRFIMSFSSSV